MLEGSSEFSHSLDPKRTLHICSIIQSNRCTNHELSACLASAYVYSGGRRDSFYIWHDFPATGLDGRRLQSFCWRSVLPGWVRFPSALKSVSSACEPGQTLRKFGKDAGIRDPQHGLQGAINGKMYRQMVNMGKWRCCSHRTWICIACGPDHGSHGISE
jgi:hypothetical protein